MSDHRTHGYVIIHKETGERWGQCFHSKGGAALSYNNHFNRAWKNEERHKFKDQDVYVLKQLVVRDGYDNVQFQLAEAVVLLEDAVDRMENFGIDGGLVESMKRLISSVDFT